MHSVLMKFSRHPYDFLTLCPACLARMTPPVAGKPEGSAPTMEPPMWIFLSIACAGLAFLLYVLVQFYWVSVRGKRVERRGLKSGRVAPQSGRVVMMVPMKTSIKDGT